MTIASPQRRRARVVGLLAVPAVVLLLLSPSAAHADVGATIIERCTHGQSLGGFSQEAYRRALAELPTEVEEYSDCANLIRRAELAAAGGGGAAGASGAQPATAIPVTPAEQSALGRLSKAGAAPVRVGKSLVRPGVIHTSVASALSSLPDPLLAVLAFLLAGALAVAGNTIHTRVRARRPR